MVEPEAPRTRLEQVLRQRHLTTEQFRKDYARVSGAELSERQAYRWVAGDISRLPYPHAQTALERMFGEPVARLLGPPYGSSRRRPTPRADRGSFDRGCARTDWAGQVVSMGAARARDFLTRAEASNVGQGTIDQLTDDVRRLVVSSQQQPLAALLGEMADTQDRAFGLLEGHQKPEQARELYVLADVATGLMAKVSHDFGAPHDALTQARAAYACADNAGHDGLKTWIRGLQSGIMYWTGRFSDSLRYALLGTHAAQRSRGTAAVRLASSEARALAALGRRPEARAALDRASVGREGVQPDELDQLGGLCLFSRPRQLYFAADALVWAGASEADRAERTAVEALDAYATAPASDRAFGDEAGTHCDLAIARVMQGELEGAAEAIRPVLGLPADQRIHGIMVSVENVRTTLRTIENSDHSMTELCDALDSFATERLAVQ